MQLVLNVVMEGLPIAFPFVAVNESLQQPVLLAQTLTDVAFDL